MLKTIFYQKSSIDQPSRSNDETTEKIIEECDSNDDKPSDSDCNLNSITLMNI